MPCPFPGMDPYIERPVIWPDFHDSLIIYTKAALQPLLRPRYLAVSEDPTLRRRIRAPHSPRRFDRPRWSP